MAKLIPLLVHLDPPNSCGAIRLDRFSPHFNQPQAFGLREVRAHSYYHYVFPVRRPDLDRLAYYFECERPEGQQPEQYTHALRRASRRWKRFANAPTRQRPRLDLRRTATAVLVSDTRPCAVRRAHRLVGLAADIYLLCDTARTIPGLLTEVGGHISESQVRGALKKLRQAKLMIEDDGLYLSLAVWRNRAPRTPLANECPSVGVANDACPPLVI
jgi:hypothetical protein